MDIINKFYITNRREVAEIINKIPIHDVLQAFYGINVTPKYSNKASIPCPIHKGKNKNFTVYFDTNTCHCFSKCAKTYNVISLAYEYLRTRDFDYMAIKLCLTFNINIEEYLRVKEGQNV